MFRWPAPKKFINPLKKFTPSQSPGSKDDRTEPPMLEEPSKIEAFSPLYCWLSSVAFRAERRIPAVVKTIINFIYVSKYMSIPRSTQQAQEKALAQCKCPFVCLFG